MVSGSIKSFLFGIIISSEKLETIITIIKSNVLRCNFFKNAGLDIGLFKVLGINSDNL